MTPGTVDVEMRAGGDAGEGESDIVMTSGEEDLFMSVTADFFLFDEYFEFN